MAEVEKIFQPYQTISRIRYNKVWDVSNQIGNSIFKAFTIKMKMWTQQSFVWAMRRIRWISMCWAI